MLTEISRNKITSREQWGRNEKELGAKSAISQRYIGHFLTNLQSTRTERNQDQQYYWTTLTLWCRVTPVCETQYVVSEAGNPLISAINFSLPYDLTGYCAASFLLKNTLSKIALYRREAVDAIGQSRVPNINEVCRGGQYESSHRVDLYCHHTSRVTVECSHFDAGSQIPHLSCLV